MLMHSTRSSIKNWRDSDADRVQYDHTVGRARSTDGPPSNPMKEIDQKRMQCDHWERSRAVRTSRYKRHKKKEEHRRATL